MNRFHCCRQICLDPFGQNMTFGANCDVNAIEPDISGDGGRVANAGPLQVFGEDADLQLPWVSGRA